MDPRLVAEMMIADTDSTIKIGVVTRGRLLIPVQICKNTVQSYSDNGKIIVGLNLIIT